MRLPIRNKIDINKKINFDLKEYKQHLDIKPNGFWYSCYSGWYNWISIELPTHLHKYIHKININKNVLTNIRKKNKDKILLINNINDLKLFNKKYGFVYKYNKDGIKGQMEMIKWDKVAIDYGGIEFNPYLKKKDYYLSKDYYLWYSAIDDAGGCVWNIKSIIKNSELIYEKKKNKYVKV